MSEYLDRVFSPASLGGLALKNRIIKAATYEGKTPNGVPGDNLKNFHKKIVAGGVAMTTIGYCTTEADGRINDQMMWLHEGIRPQLTNMISELKEIAPRRKSVRSTDPLRKLFQSTKDAAFKAALGTLTSFQHVGRPLRRAFCGRNDAARHRLPDKHVCGRRQIYGKRRIRCR